MFSCTSRQYGGSILPSIYCRFCLKFRLL